MLERMYTLYLITNLLSILNSYGDTNVTISLERLNFKIPCLITFTPKLRPCCKLDLCPKKIATLVFIQVALVYLSSVLFVFITSLINKFLLLVTKAMWLIQCFRVSFDCYGALCCFMGEE